MKQRNKIALKGLLGAAISLAACHPSLAQSGAASLHGWVAFENVAYVDKQPTAKVVLRHDPPESNVVYSTETDEHGFFNFPHTSLGRFKLEITCKGYQPYSADVYVPSDFAGNWAVELKQQDHRTTGPLTTDNRYLWFPNSVWEPHFLAKLCFHSRAPHLRFSTIPDHCHRSITPFSTESA